MPPEAGRWGWREEWQVRTRALGRLGPACCRVCWIQTPGPAWSEGVGRGRGLGREDTAGGAIHTQHPQTQEASSSLGGWGSEAQHLRQTDREGPGREKRYFHGFEYLEVRRITRTLCRCHVPGFEVEYGYLRCNCWENWRRVRGTSLYYSCNSL